MKVYISVDMEGIGGIAALDQVVRGGHGYPRAQALMTAEANAAIAGAFDGGADTVLVNDSHGTMDNLIHEDLDPRARLVFGTPKAQCMAEGMQVDHDVALFVGYHAPAGGPGVLAHTFSAYFAEVRLGGRPVSETTVNALYAATLGVPIGLVSGDDVICGLAEAALPGVVTVPVKQAHGFSATDTLPPSLAREAVRAGASRAVAKAAELKPLAVPDALVLEIDMPNPTAAELAELIPGARRTSAVTVAQEVGSMRDVMGLIVVCYELANSSMQSRRALMART
jgi:D-amino peptidase